MISDDAKGEKMNWLIKFLFLFLVLGVGFLEVAFTWPSWPSQAKSQPTDQKGREEPPSESSALTGDSDAGESRGGDEQVVEQVFGDGETKILTEEEKEKLGLPPDIPKVPKIYPIYRPVSQAVPVYRPFSSPGGGGGVSPAAVTVVKPAVDPAVTQVQRQLRDVIQLNETIKIQRQTNMAEMLRLLNQIRANQELLKVLEEAKKQREEEKKKRKERGEFDVTDSDELLRQDKLRAVKDETEKNEDILRSLIEDEKALQETEKKPARNNEDEELEF